MKFLVTTKICTYQLKNKMKKLLLFIIPLIIIGCGPQKEELSETGKILNGSHKLCNLRTVKADTVQSGKHYFAFKDDKITFCWTLNDKSVTITTLNMNMVRFSYNDTDEPTIKFRWVPSKHTDIEDIFREKLEYVIITCNENDIPNKNKK